MASEIENDGYSRELEEEQKTQQDKQLKEEFADDPIGLILTINNPTIHKFSNHDIQDKDKERIVKEFININKELGLGILSDDELLIVREYNTLIAYEMRKGYWRTAASDIQDVQTLVIASRSKQGQGLKLLFTRIVERVFKEEKPKKDLLR